MKGSTRKLIRKFRSGSSKDPASRQMRAKAIRGARRAFGNSFVRRAYTKK